MDTAKRTPLRIDVWCGGQMRLRGCRVVSYDRDIRSDGTHPAGNSLVKGVSIERQLPFISAHAARLAPNQYVACNRFHEPRILVWWEVIGKCRRRSAAKRGTLEVRGRRSDVGGQMS